MEYFSRRMDVQQPGWSDPVLFSTDKIVARDEALHIFFHAVWIYFFIVVMKQEEAASCCSQPSSILLQTVNAPFELTTRLCVCQLSVSTLRTAVHLGLSLSW